MPIRSFGLILCALLLSLVTTAALGATLTLSRSSVSCPTAFVGRSTMCNETVIATATGGSVTLRATAPLTAASIVGWFNSPQQCTAGKVLANGESCTFGIGMNSASAGSFNNTFTLNSANANSASVTASIQVIGLSASGLASSCGSVTLGSSKSCGSLTLTASGGTVVLGGGAPVSSSNSEFPLSMGTCTAGKALAAGQSCTTGALMFTPQSVGTLTTSINVMTTAGMLSLPVQGSAFTFEWQPGAWTPESDSGCTDSLAQTRTVVCKRNDGATVSDASCVEPKPEMSRNVSDLSGCTFSWNESGFGTCTGGSGSWVLSDWDPAAGCGLIAQSRSANCAVVAGSGIRTQSVICLRSDGVQVADGQCETATKPATSESCTPTQQSACGAPPSTQQNVELDSGCVSTACVPDAANNKYCLLMPM